MIIQESNNKKYFFIILVCILFVVTILSISYGPVSISIKQIFEILLYRFGLIDEYSFNQIQETVLINIRFPRIFLAILVGVGLATSGAILQGLFRNPLIDPGFIGVSSGAAVGAMIAIMFSGFFAFFIPSFLYPFILPILAILGSFLTTIIVYKMSKIFNKTNILAMLLSGIAVNALAGAFIGLFVSISNDVQLRTFTFWTLGGLDNANWFILLITSIFILFPFIFVYKKKSELDIFMLGDAEASNLGLKVEKLKKTIVVISSIMVGISVAFCGMIGFVGLVTPHLVRLFIGPNHKNLISGSALLGAILLTLSDLIAKTIIAPAQLPIGVVTSAIGAPFFVWLIINQKRRFNYSE